MSNRFFPAHTPLFLVYESSDEQGPIYSAHIYAYYQNACNDFERRMIKAASEVTEDGHVPNIKEAWQLMTFIDWDHKGKNPIRSYAFLDNGNDWHVYLEEILTDFVFEAGRHHFLYGIFYPDYEHSWPLEFFKTVREARKCLRKDITEIYEVPTQGKALAAMRAKLNPIMKDGRYVYEGDDVFDDSGSDPVHYMIAPVYADPAGFDVLPDKHGNDDIPSVLKDANASSVNSGKGQMTLIVDGLTFNAKMYECDSKYCRLNPHGYCLASLLDPDAPRITDKDGCLSFIYKDRQ